MNADAARLRELLVAAGVSGFRDVAIEDDAPSEVRDLWSALGWSDAFAKAGLVAPERAVALARAKGRLAEWRRRKMATLTIDDLPARFRVIEDDGAGVGFGIVDETKKTAVVCAVLCDANAVKRTKESYAVGIAARLIRAFFSGPYAQVDGASKGEALLPVLLPGFVRLGEGLVADATPSGLQRLHFASPKHLFAWLEAATKKTLGFVLPLGALPMFGRTDEVLRRVTVTRTWRGTKKVPGTLVLGRLEDLPVLVSHEGKACAIWGEDIARIGAAFSGLAPGARAWPSPGVGEWAAFTDRAPPPTLDDETFAAAASGFAAVARALGRTRVGTAPNDAPKRLAAVAREGDVAIGAIEDRLAAETWIPTRYERPARHRWIAGGARGAERWAIVTDEDVSSDDPPAVYYATHVRRAVLAGVHTSAVFVRATLERWAEGHVAGAWFPAGRPREEVLLDAFGVRATRFGDGVLGLPAGVVFRDMVAYATYLRTLEAPLLGSFQPPLASARFPAPKPKKKKGKVHPLVPASLVADGFRVAPIVTSTSRKGQTMGVGFAGGVPTWILHDDNPRLSGIPTLVCAHEHAAKVKAWAAKRVDR